MNTRIFEAFDIRERQVSDYMAGCGQKYGMPCTCNPGECRCAKCADGCNSKQQQQQPQTANDLLNSTQHQLQLLQQQQQQLMAATQQGNNDMFGNQMMQPMNDKERVQSRNPSIISFGGNMRHMSITSEATFGRAMSGLSALSIDWENMEDFDINVDHSAHINNAGGVGGDGSGVPQFQSNRRSSLRRSMNNNDTDMGSSAQVSFQV